MEYVKEISVVLTVLIIPWLVQLIKTEALTGKAARWASIGVTLVFGLIAGFLTGIPDSAVSWSGFIFAMVGGVQVAYTAFNSVGITSKWLDALLQIGKDEQ